MLWSQVRGKIMGYWRKVFARAWADTKQSFGWNQKTVATVLVALVGIGVAFVQLGFAAMLTSATGVFWTALPFVIAGCVLLVWNFISVPPALDAELGKKVAALEATLANSQQPPPDYMAWRHVDRMTLGRAAYLWCDLSPGAAMPPHVRAWYEALASAIRRGELNFEPRPAGIISKRERELEKNDPTRDATVTRAALQAFAKMHGYEEVLEGGLTTIILGRF